ncbi:MAG: hypothetical protein WCZ66_09955 [Sphingomonadaceae bacterium]
MAATRERLAFKLMDTTGQRRGDAVRLGPQYIRGDRLEFAAQDRLTDPDHLAISHLNPLRRNNVYVTHGDPYGRGNLAD